MPAAVPARPLTAGAAAPTPDEIYELRLVAAGREVADVAIRGGRVVHVHTGEVLAADVIVHGRHIAAVVPPGRLEARTDVDASGMYLAPTFIDAHFHPEYTMLLPGETARLVVPRGTTTLLADPVCIANVLGARGMDLVAATTTPLRLFAQVTPDVPRRGREGLNGARVSQAEILERVRRQSAVSLGESNPFNLDREMAEALSVTLDAGKRATGHTARLSGEPLWAYAAGGVGDDHNAATLEEVIERLRLGMIVTLQSGSMTDYCEAILGRPELLGMVESHLCFCADDKHVEDLHDQGAIDHHVRSAVALGVAPAVAVRMASLNAASHFRIDHLIGSITPSRLADLQFLPDLERFEPVSVWVDGREVARDGAALFANTDPVPDEALGTVHLGPAPKITVGAPADRDTAWVQAMEMYDGYYKRAFHVELDVVTNAAGERVVQPSPADDIAKICIVDRHHATGTAGVGFVRGFGLRAGAIAASTNCDNQNIVVVGTSDDEIAHALDAMAAIGGGYVAVRDGQVLASVPLPVAGIMSDQPWETVYRQSREVNAAAAELGCSIHAPFMILAFVGLGGVPDLGLSEMGLLDVATQTPIPVVIELDGERPVCRCSASRPFVRAATPAAPPVLDEAAVRALPKVELHVHLEGTFSKERIVAMADAAGEPLPKPVEHLFEFDDLHGFLGFLDWTCRLIRTPELAAQVAYDFAERAANDGTVYAEVIINPTHWTGWDLGELVESLTVGFERAEADGLAECHLLLSILRAQSAEEALALVEWMGANRPRRVLGLSVDGDERRSGRTGPRFEAAYRRAGELGFGRTAHAGESSGAEGVRDAVDLFGVDRIDHGVRVIEDPELVQQVIDAGITLNVCLSSNLVHLYGSLEDHPFRALHLAGVRTTINTDDPGYLGIDLTGEFEKAAHVMGWGLAELADVTHRAIDASFCPPATKERLHAQVSAHLQETVSR